MDEPSHPASPRRRWIASALLCAWGIVLQVVLRTHLGDEMTGAARLAAWGISWLTLGIGLVLATHDTPLFRPVGGAALLAALGGFGLTVNGLAFGPGPVECTRALSVPFGVLSGEAGDLECRVAAGALLAIPYDSVLLAVLLLLPGLGLHDGRLPRLLRALAGVCVVLGFLPYLLMIAAVVLLVDRRAGWERMARALKTEMASLGAALTGAPPPEGMGPRG
jgi:hypothetical protein